MSSTFGEAWDLLLSDPSTNNESNQLSKPNLRPLPFPQDAILPSRSTTRQKRPASGSESCRTTLSTASPRFTHEDEDVVKTATSARRQLSNSQSVAKQQASQQEPSSDVAGLLQSLRHDLNSLQYSGYPHDDLNTLAVTHLNRKLELLTDAVVSTTSSVVPTPAEASKPNSIDSSSSSSKVADQDRQCSRSCCGGRKFSNKSNLIRHKRERSGETGKLRCSFCNACFSRSSVRNAHEAKRICKKTKSNHSY